MTRHSHLLLGLSVQRQVDQARLQDREENQSKGFAVDDILQCTLRNLDTSGNGRTVWL